MIVTCEDMRLCSQCSRPTFHSDNEWPFGVSQVLETLFEFLIDELAMR